MIDKIGHYSLTAPASVYDEEAMTALELAGRTAAKVNECVDEVNRIPKKVEDEFKENVNDGTFDKMIDEYAGDIKKRVENILSGLPENPTAMDAEVIDIRLDVDGKTYPTAGDALRALSRNSLSIKDANSEFWVINNDVNTIVNTGIYFLSSARTWTNMPSSTDDVGFLLVTNDPTRDGRKAQLFISNDGKLALRHFNGNAFGEWHVLTDEKYVRGIYDTIMAEVDKSLKFTEVSDAETVDVDELITTGCYMFGSAHTVVNAPSKIGMLLVYKGKQDYNVYQTWHAYDGEIYTRNYIYNEGFTEWERVLHEKDVVSSGGGELTHRYHVVKPDVDTFHVEQRGVKGVVRYVLKRTADDEGNYGFGIRGVYLVDKAGNATVLVGEGADIDGVVKYVVDEEHVGGVHGSENGSASIFVNGVDIREMATFEGDTDYVFIVYNSLIIPRGDADLISAKRIWTFDDNGLFINNKFFVEGDFNTFNKAGLEKIECAMMSVQKGVVSHYIYTNDKKSYLPSIEGIPPVSEEKTHLIDAEGYYPHGITYIGDGISIECSFDGYVGGASLDYDDAGFFKLVDYGERVKSYYYYTSMGASSIITESFIKITY